MSKGLFSFRDRSAEISSIELNFIDVAAGGANFDTVTGYIDAVGAALETASLCEESKEALKQNTEADVATVPTDVHAQRESGCRVFYSDNVNGKVYHFTIPGPDKDNMALLAGTDLYDLTDTELAAVVTAVENGVLSMDGNAVTVLRAVDVGRNN